MGSLPSRAFAGPLRLCMNPSSAAGLYPVVPPVPPAPCRVRAWLARWALRTLPKTSSEGPGRSSHARSQALPSAVWGGGLFLAVPGEQAQASPSRGARSMACTGPTGRSSLATVLPPVTPPPQTQVPAQDDTGQGCGDSRLSPGHRDAGRLVTLQLRASESWHHKTEGRPVPSLTLPPAGSQGALPVKGFSRHADIYKCLILAA